MPASGAVGGDQRRPCPGRGRCPDVFWFDRRLRVWFSAQRKPAPLAIVIAGTGGDGNTSSLSMLRARSTGRVTTS